MASLRDAKMVPEVGQGFEATLLIDQSVDIRENAHEVWVALLFGGAKLPKLARSLGQAQNEFKRGLKDGAENTDHDETTAERTKDA